MLRIEKVHCHILFLDGPSLRVVWMTWMLDKPFGTTFKFPTVTFWLTKLKVLESFLYLISLLHTSRSESTPTYPQDCLCYPFCSFWIPRRYFWSHNAPRRSRLSWTDYWDTYPSFLFASMKSWSSVRTRKNTLSTFDKCGQSWGTTSSMHGLQNASFTRNPFSLWHIVSYDGVRPSPYKIIVVQSWPVPKNVKTLLSFLYSWNLWTSTDDSSRTALTLANVLTKDAVLTGKLAAKMLLITWDTVCSASPSWGIMILPCLHESRLTLLDTSLMLCRNKNILMVGTL